LPKGPYILADAESGTARATIFRDRLGGRRGVEAREPLQAAGRPPRSSPCVWELFWEQPAEYRHDHRRHRPGAVEAATRLGWERFAARRGFVGMTSFGASGRPPNRSGTSASPPPRRSGSQARL